MVFTWAKKRYGRLDKKERILFWAGILYVILFLVFYPKYYLINDEHHYIRGAKLLTEGKLWIDDPLQGYHFVSDGERYFPRYPPGMYILLAPFAYFGLSAVFLLGLILHIVGFIVFTKLLRLLKIDILGALLYLVYPPFAYYSATAFSDYPFTVFLLLGVYFYLKKRPLDHILSGVFFGFSFLIKAHAPVFFAVFFLFALCKDRKKFFFMAAGSIPFALIHAGYNWIVNGGPLTFGYAFFNPGYGQGSNPFLTQNIISQFAMNMFKQGVLLLILYPLMLFSLFKTKMKEMKYAAWAVLIFFSTIVYTSVVTSLDWFIVVQYRYVMPVVIFLLPGYFVLLMSTLKRVTSAKRAKQAYAVFIVAFFVMSAILLLFIQSASSRNYEVMNDIVTMTDEDTLVRGRYLGEMMNEFYGRDYLTLYDENEASSYQGYYTEEEKERIIEKRKTVIIISEQEEEGELIFEKEYRSAWMGNFFKIFNMKWYVVKNGTGNE